MWKPWTTLYPSDMPTSFFKTHVIQQNDTRDKIDSNHEKRGQFRLHCMPSYQVAINDASVYHKTHETAECTAF